MPSNPFRVTQTGLSTGANGFTSILFPDYDIRPFSVGVGCVASSTSLTYSIQHSYDYTGSSTFISSNATWFTNTSFSSATGSAEGSYAYPVSAIRLNVTATTTSTASNTVSMTAIQAG